jgi:hypothetical protein
VSKISTKPSARKKHHKKSTKTWMVCGFDLSMSSIAGAAYCYDGTLRKEIGPSFTMKLWEKNTHYFERITDAALAHNFIHDLQVGLKVVAELDEIYIAVEEPFPVGMVKRLESQSIKQQAEISGAFLGGLLRYGYKNLFQISWQSWAALVAGDLGITTHHSKWNYNSTPNPFKLAPNGKGSGKWRAKEWALNSDYEVKKWKDLINHHTRGKIHRPKESKARGVQPDDRYDALGVMHWMRTELGILGIS